MVVCLVFFLCASHTGVVIVDNVWFYEGDLTSSVLNAGDIVETIEQKDDMVRIRYNNEVGLVNKGVLIDFREQIAEERLFVFARGYFDQAEYRKAAKLFNIFINNFDQSQYLTEALYYYGMSNEELMSDLDKIDTIPNFLFNERYNIWYYSGDAYIKILETFPESKYASKASYRLLHILRMSNLPWQDSIQIIEEDLDMWHNFVQKYGDTEEYVLALLEIGYLNRVLFEITDDSSYKVDAAEVFQEVIAKYPGSVYSAQSKVNLREIEEGENIYKY